MKLVSLILLSIALAGCSNSDQAKQDEWKQLESQMDDRTAQLKEQVLQQRIRYVRITFGDVAARRYELCNTVPPTLKKNQEACARLDARVKKSMDSASKW